MAAKKKATDKWTTLSWNDLNLWSGDKIAARGKNYQRQGLVSDLKTTVDGGLVAWVEGTERYATRVDMDSDGDIDSVCTCPYGLDCKHGVAVVLEYLEQIEKKHHVAKAAKDDERLRLIEEDAWDDDIDDFDEDDDEDDGDGFDDLQEDIDHYLKGKTKSQLIDLIHEVARTYPAVARDLSDRRQLTSGNTKTMVSRLRAEIRDLGDDIGWQNYWTGEGHTPDYSQIRDKLAALLKAGHADAVLELGKELVDTGIGLVEASDDEGETMREITDCLPVIVTALDRSSLSSMEKLNWALDAELEDQYGVCEAFAEYLFRDHPPVAWSAFADLLLPRLKALKAAKNGHDFSQRFARERLGDWAIHALESAGRDEEIIPLCQAEARITGSYDRLVKRLMASRKYKDAEEWIIEGISATKERWPGIASDLRAQMHTIRERQKNWPAVAAMQIEAYVRHPSHHEYEASKKACQKIKAWPTVRACLLHYLETGDPPWDQKKWPLPESGLDRPEAGQRNRFPMTDALIDIAIAEKKPDQVLKWYDRAASAKSRWGGYNVDAVADAVATHAPDRATAIWKKIAEGLIARVKPSAYRDAAKYLRKIEKVMRREKQVKEWHAYIITLREAHRRKIRLMEVLDGLDGKPIVDVNAKRSG